MFERLSDRWRKEAVGAARLAAIAAAGVAAAGVALAFLCAAAFVAVLERYGLVDACLAGAAAFLAATVVLLVAYAGVAASSRQEARLRAMAEPPSSPSPLADPRLILVGLQVAQAIGFKRLLPILAVGGAAFLLARRPDAGSRRARARGYEAPPLP
jgi:hypothetical protein